jgi:transcriptional regulator with XRE-family HTH domain
MEPTARLIQLRKNKGLSQQALADAMGIHVTQVKRYEPGANQPSLEVTTAAKRVAHAAR